MKNPQLLLFLSKPHHGGILTSGNMPVSHDERTPLHLTAACSTSPDVVECADVDARAYNEHTPLHLAARHNPCMVATLIAHKANVYLVDKYGWSALAWAARENHVEAINALLKGGANVNQLNNSQYSPLLWAAMNNHRETVTALLGAGADPHLGDSPLDHYLVRDEMKSLSEKEQAGPSKVRFNPY